MTTKPLIGIVPLIDYARDSYWMLPGYFKGIEEAGGIPVMLPLTNDELAISQLVGSLDGFLLTGGQDVSPELYGQTVTEACGETSPERDDMELALLREVLTVDLPVFGICRGIQFLNVALGGTLYADIPTQLPSLVNHHQSGSYEDPSHAVQLVPNTPIADLLQVESLMVNSYHHQGICDLAENLQPMATAPDGLVEAVWLPSAQFTWAVQWHPEFSYKKDEAAKKLFQAFVNVAASR